MTNNNLGKLHRIELREIWTTEAGDFTPWLAGEENLALLGDTINLDLELEAQEKNVGPFRADILCKETNTGAWVLIENQLERTDHTHLGQLLTYAAGLKAVTIVWIARRFTEEHRAALDWLNDITDDRFNFFGLEVELWRIGDSPIAPKFNVASKPNDWSRTVSSAAGKLQEGELSETKILQREYWTALMTIIEDRGGPIRTRKPRPQHWADFSIGRAWFNLTASMDTGKGIIRTELYLGGPEATPHFLLLRKQAEAIETELGTVLEWQDLPGKKACKITLHNHEVDPTDRSDWDTQHAWFVMYLEKFHQAFSQRVRDLDAATWETEAEFEVG